MSGEFSDEPDGLHRLIEQHERLMDDIDQIFPKPGTDEMDRDLELAEFVSERVRRRYRKET